jgi:hypothetical protein
MASTLNYVLEWVEFTFSFAYYDLVCKIYFFTPVRFTDYGLSFTSYVDRKRTALLLLWLVLGRAQVFERREHTL